MPEGMRILVTGGAGFIGSRLVRHLVFEGHRVVVADNLVTTRSLYLLDEVISDVEFVHLDVRCAEDFARLPRGHYDRVYHLAASFANALSVEHPTLDARTNVEGTNNVIQHARKAGCGLLVYTGSSSSYGDAPLPLAEEGPMRPATPYATSKLSAEWQVRGSALSHAIFRLFNVYGPGDPPGPYRNAIPRMAQAASAPGGHIEIYGEDATRDFTYVEDVVRILAEPDVAAGKTINVGTGSETPVLHVARSLLRLLDVPSDRLHVVARRSWDQVVRRVADVTRLRMSGAAIPQTPLEEGLAATVRWLSEMELIGARVD